MQQVFIFEGPDNVGKSTISTSLSQKLGIPSFKNTLEKDSFLDRDFGALLKYCGPFMLDFLKQTGYSAIFDRSYPSEWVYSDVFKRNTDQNVLNYLDEEYAKLGAIIVLCLKRSYKEYHDPLIDISYIQLLRAKFLKFADWSRCHCLVLDTSDESLEYQIDTIMMFEKYWRT